MQPLQYDLRSPAAKNNSITNAATARSNLDAAIYTAETILQLQITMKFHRQLIHQHHLQFHLHCGNAKFQTDLITITSRKRTQWGRPPPRRVFKQKHKTPK